jgi:hypothetical protein
MDREIGQQGAVKEIDQVGIEERGGSWEII